MSMATEEEEGASALFRAFDRNKDGRLSFEDLRQGFRKSGFEITNEDLKELVERFDQDGDGALNFSEMLSVMAVLQKSNSDKSEIMKVFSVMDKNGNKRISKFELQHAMALYCDTHFTDKEIDDIMIKVDFDNDGFISFNEFARCIHLFKK